MFSLRAILMAAAFAVFAVATQLQPVAAYQSEVDQVLGFAQAQLNKPFQLGATGMQRFDCSGLVYRTYFETGLLSKISGHHLRARGYYHWFKSHGLLTNNPRPGDLVVWAYRYHPVTHIGIFTGYSQWGKAMAISALINPYGVTEHKVSGIGIPVKAYLRVNLDR